MREVADWGMMVRSLIGWLIGWDLQADAHSRARVDGWLHVGEVFATKPREGGTILSNASNLVELSAACLKNSFLYIKATSLTCRFLTIPRRRQSTNSLIFIKERFLVLLVSVISNRSIKG